MESSRHAILPLWSRAVAIVLGVLALATASFVFHQGSYVATLRIDRHEPSLDRPAHYESLLFGGRQFVPATHIHATYTVTDGLWLRAWERRGDLRALYQHAAGEPGNGCQITLSEPRPEPTTPGEAIVFEILPLGGIGSDTAPPTESLSFGACDASTRSELEQQAARLDAWLLAGAHGTFEDRIGSRWRGAHSAALVLLVYIALLAPMILLRIDVEAGASSVRVVRRFGPIQRVIAEVLLSEIRGVRIATIELGPFTLHRPTLYLANSRSVELWPFGRPGLANAFAARNALVRLLDEHPREGEAVEAGGVPFRGRVLT